MKKITLLVVLSFILGSISIANPWGHRYTTEQSTQNIFVDINTSFRVSIEWNQGDWVASDFGYGYSTDGSDWTWTDIPWFENGSDNNKRCRLDVSISTPGKYYYAYRMIKGGITSYSFGSDTWAENLSTLTATSTIIVGEVSSQAGDWASTSSWEDGTVPTSSDNVAIMHDIIVSTTGAVANDVYIYSGKTLTINAGKDLTVNGTLTNNAGTSGLTLKSDNTGTASLIETNGVSASVERYLTADRWHSVSIPVTAATANSYLGMYLIYYDESTSTWPYVTDPNAPLGVGVGYSAWPTANATANFSGALNAGTVVLPVTNLGDRWNLVGNPYPSAIDWGGSGWSRNDMDAGAYVWNGSQYLSNVSGTGLGSLPGGIIPAQQSFFVRVVETPANPPASISVSNASRVHGVDPYKNTVTTDMIKLKVVGNNYSDETFIALNSESTFDFDGQYDAYKLMGITEAPQLYSVAGEDILSINSIPAITKGLSIPLNFQVGATGIYEITLNEINGFDNVPVFLEDLQEHKVVDLKANNLYKCEAFPSDDPMRFLLHFSYEDSPFSGSTSDNSGVLIVPVDKTILISSEKALNGIVIVYNLLGQEMESQPLNNVSSIQIPVASEAGYYIIRVQSDSGVTTKKLFIK